MLQKIGGGSQKADLINIFEQKRVRGYLPFEGDGVDDEGNKILAGKVEVRKEKSKGGKD